MSKYLYTVVCRYYTTNGIIEYDLYEVLKRLRMERLIDIQPYYDVFRVEELARFHVYTGQAVEYIIKKVLRDIKLEGENKYFYSPHEPWSILYDGWFDLKEIDKLNNLTIQTRLQMSEEDFQKIYGGKISGKDN